MLLVNPNSLEPKAETEEKVEVCGQNCTRPEVNVSRMSPKLIQQKRSVILVLSDVSAVAKNVNFKLSWDEFFMMSISKIMVPL